MPKSAKRLRAQPTWRDMLVAASRSRCLLPRTFQAKGFSSWEIALGPAIRGPFPRGGTYVSARYPHDVAPATFEREYSAKRLHTKPQPNSGASSNINRAAARAGPRQGNSRLDSVADRKIDARV